MSAVHCSQDGVRAKGTGQVHNTQGRSGHREGGSGGYTWTPLELLLAGRAVGKCAAGAENELWPKAIVCVVNKTMFYLFNLCCLFFFLNAKGLF